MPSYQAKFIGTLVVNVHVDGHVELKYMFLSLNSLIVVQNSCSSVHQSTEVTCVDSPSIPQSRGDGNAEIRPTS